MWFVDVVRAFYTVVGAFYKETFRRGMATAADPIVDVQGPPYPRTMASSVYFGQM